MRAIIFDLDGVVADTAKYHCLAWKRLAKENLAFEFDTRFNEQLKGISRMASLEIVLKAGNVSGLSEEEKGALAKKKNDYYLEYISNIDSSQILPGISAFLKKVKEAGFHTGLGSASMSGKMILEKLGIASWFDVIVDGNLVCTPKPNPEVFTTAADLLGISYGNCIVVEDARAGVEAARNAGMKCIAIGKKELLGEADIVIASTVELNELDLEKDIQK